MPRMKADQQVTIRKPVKRVKRPKIPQNEVNNSNSIISEDDVDEVPDSSIASEDEKNNTESECNPQDFNGEMSKLLERFSSDINKTMQAKRQKLEQFTQESIRSTAKKVLETNKYQSIERQKVIEQFKKQFESMIHQGESELERLKETEEKLQKLFSQGQKQQQQVRSAYAHNVKALKSLGANFCKGMTELEGKHVEQYSSVHSELRKEMALLQKKILMETQQQEMMNVRKHLKQLIS